MSKPYAFINDRIQTYFTLKARVAGGAKFDVLNAHIRNVVVMPGQLVIVSDGSSGPLTAEETELMTNIARYGMFRRTAYSSSVGLVRIVLSTPLFALQSL